MQTLSIKYSKVSDFHGYFNSNFDGDKENGLFASFYLMILGSNAITWWSKKLTISTDFTTKVEYVALA